jgi:hypothetical protein
LNIRITSIRVRNWLHYEMFGNNFLALGKGLTGGNDDISDNLFAKISRNIFWKRIDQVDHNRPYIPIRGPWECCGIFLTKKKQTDFLVFRKGIRMGRNNPSQGSTIFQLLFIPDGLMSNIFIQEPLGSIILLGSFCCLLIW